ncbi:hypothetical protein A3I18_01355 [Candidatus Campbellbacteria bacterium RIFCSPLOWO2_02_FULL_35_11]|uniref:Uncharacterized protein n=2 Tax=Candidatus Campbelliibacteriota TaxID=1752727 RepID=A0A1F5EMS6_9BACT|nr:MAG: hypothetical protein A3E89_01850 [Candidatus Campbellbacteria bacterium RIFCSPHIGHO2_12_FULL_35_10]OGD70306.1 MAG: hypothetical protein A3I18_01355 [Candidatus Campbellbacteria bacterium RIFCSPLOWO2_02_FULL_35_11]
MKVCPVVKTICTKNLVIGGPFSKIEIITPFETDEWGNLKKMASWEEVWAEFVMGRSGTIPRVDHWSYIMKVQDLAINLAVTRNGLFGYRDLYVSLGKEVEKIEKIFSQGMNEVCCAAGIPTLRRRITRIERGE